MGERSRARKEQRRLERAIANRLPVTPDEARETVRVEVARRQRFVSRALFVACSTTALVAAAAGFAAARALGLLR